MDANLLNSIEIAVHVAEVANVPVTFTHKQARALLDEIKYLQERLRTAEGTLVDLEYSIHHDEPEQFEEDGEQ